VVDVDHAAVQAIDLHQVRMEVVDQTLRRRVNSVVVP